MYILNTLYLLEERNEMHSHSCTHLHIKCKQQSSKLQSPYSSCQNPNHRIQVVKITITTFKVSQNGIHATQAQILPSTLPLGAIFTVNCLTLLCSVT